MRKRNIAWLLSAAMVLTTEAAPVEAVYAAEEFQAEEMEEGTEASTGVQESLFEDRAEEINEDEQTGSSDTAEIYEDGEADSFSTVKQKETEEFFSDGEATVAVAGKSSEVIESGVCGSDAIYKLYADGRLVIEGTGDVVEYYFSLAGKIKSVVIGEGITSLNERIFSGCDNIASVILPESLTSLKYATFAGCSSLSTIILPKGLTSIGNEAFRACSSLSTIILPENLNYVGDDVFLNCSSLTSVNIPKKMTAIGKGMFQGCNSLTSIQLPDSITEIGSYAFSGCSLTSIEFSANVTKIGDGAFTGCAIKKVILPDTITEVGAGAFAECGDLRSVKLSESLNRIGDRMFFGCSRLDSIVLPERVTEIGDEAFSNSGLTEIKLSQNLKTIGSEAFSLNNLKSVELPETITDIGEKAFVWNSNLQSINIPKNVTEIKEGTFQGCSSLHNITLPEGLLKIGKNAFNRTSLAEVTLPDSVTTIEESAFENCALNGIKLSKNLTEIPYGAFSNCMYLTEVILPDSITYVDTHAFFNCIYLRSFYIANPSTVIEKKAFGYNEDGTKTYSLVMGHKGSAAETYATENDFPFHNIEDPLTYHEKVEPTCVSDGNWPYWHCDECNRDFSNEEGSGVIWGDLTISKLGHNLTYHEWKNETCIQPGNRLYYHCETCGKNFSDWNGETEISDQDIVIPAPGHQMTCYEKIEPTCTYGGRKACYYCTRCDQYFLDQEGKQEVAEADLMLPITPQNHKMTYQRGYEATCTSEGRKSYYICDNCQQMFFDKKGTEKVAEDSDLVIPELGHKYTSWQWTKKESGKHTVSRGNPTPIFFTADYQQFHKCERCGFKDLGETRTYNMSVNTDQVTLKNMQSTTAVRVSKFTNGDYLKSVTSKDTSLVTVSDVNKKGTFKLTAKNKNGSAWVTITLNSGVTTNILVTVRVTTQAITNLKSTVSVVRGKTATLKPVLKPVTSQDEIKYSSSNKNIAAVNSKGVITGRKVGTAKITVTSGSKKFIVTVKVTKIKTTKLTGVPKTKTLSRGKTFTIKAVATPKNTDENITYKSSNTKIATVTSKGVVKGIKKGTATITVQSGTKKLTCKVTVK